jgi:regulatory protein
MTEPTSRRPAYARLLDRAVRILAVRDHSEQELRQTVCSGDEQKRAGRD